VGLVALFGGVKPTKAPRGEGTAASYTSGQPSYPRGHPTCWASSQRNCTVLCSIAGVRNSRREDQIRPAWIWSS